MNTEEITPPEEMELIESIDEDKDLGILANLERLAQDMRAAAKTLSPDEARYVVDAYYQMQETRKASANQARGMSKLETKEPHLVISWLTTNAMVLERNIKTMLDAYTESIPIGRWAKSIVGIGPVIAAGLAAHIDIAKAQTAGSVWRFAGQDPSVRWEKGKKRPWNASLKTLCWKIGESFVKVSNKDGDFYGKLWRERKLIEEAHNEAGDFAEQAKEKLERFKIGKSTVAYKAYIAGKLPPGHIHARAKRWAVKLFLSHWHYVAYEIYHGKPPADPYAVSQLGHVHIIGPPNWPMK